MSEYDHLKQQYDALQQRERALIVRASLQSIADTLYEIIQEYDPNKEGHHTFDDAIRLAHARILNYEHTHLTLLPIIGMQDTSRCQG